MDVNEQYERAWDDIRQGLGALGDHLDEARAFVGDRALLDLLKQFDPGEVIIAIGIEIVSCVLGPDGRREAGARLDRDCEPIELAVAAAHAALVEREGDECWRRSFPPDIRATMLRELQKLGAPLSH